MVFVLGIVYAVGFHSANEIIGGTFQGNYIFNGTLTAPNIQNDISKAIFLGGISNSNSIIYLTNGFFDSFNDENGISSYNGSYISNDNAYSNRPTTFKTSSSGEWTQGVGFSFSGDDITVVTNDESMYLNDNFTGDFEFSWRYNSANCFTFVGLFEAANVGSFDVSLNGQNSISGWVWENHGCQDHIGDYVVINAYVTDSGDVSPSNGDKITFKRVGSTITLLKNDITIYTFSTTSSATLKAFVIQGNGASGIMNDVNWTYSGDVANSYLSSINYTATSAPSQGTARVIYEDIDPITLNSDLNLQISNDGGSNWDSVSLSYDSNISSSQKIATGEGTFSGSGTDIKYNLSTSSQEVKIHGIGMNWN